MKRTLSITRDFLSLAEGTLFVEMLLAKWNHPMASDPDYVEHLAEIVSELLTAIEDTGQPDLGLQPDEIGLVAAVAYVEGCAVREAKLTDSPGEHERRLAWIDRARAWVQEHRAPPAG